MSQGLGPPSCSSFIGRPHIGRAILLQSTFHDSIIYKLST
ncbi:hypothetical protein LINPERHAP1_LOCUS36816 [Linum perenne]